MPILKSLIPSDETVEEEDFISVPNSGANTHIIQSEISANQTSCVCRFAITLFAGIIIFIVRPRIKRNNS